MSVASVAAISGLYDLVVGAFLLLAPGLLASLFGVSLPTPRIFSDLNAIFLLGIGIGYYFPWREPGRYRGYMWVMGPLLKGAGATLFIADYLYRGSPASFLLFAASDGSLALLTLYALLREPADGAGRGGVRPLASATGAGSRPAGPAQSR